MDQNVGAQRARKAKLMLTYEETKQELLNLYAEKLNGSRKTITALRFKKYNYLVDALLYHTNFLDFDKCDYNTRIYHILSDLHEPTKCLCCGKPVLRNGDIQGLTLKYCCRQCSAKHGVSKCQQTKLERYGSAGYMNPDKVRETWANKTTDELEEIKQKHIDTSRILYGTDHPMQSDKVQTKSKQTCEERYGVDNFAKSDEFLIRSRATSQERYGTNNPMQNPEVAQHLKDTLSKKTSEDWQEISLTRQQTCLDRYGVPFASQVEEVRQKNSSSHLARTPEQLAESELKRITTCLDIYGTEYPTQCKSVKLKTKQTCIERFGVPFPLPAVINRRSQYLYKDSYFDSSYELIFFIAREITGNPVKRNTNKFSYFVDEKEHFYYPDFVDEDNNYIEIKGAHFFDIEGHLINPFTNDVNIQVEFRLKGELMEYLGVQVIKDIEPYRTIVDETFGKNYVDQFRVVKF